MSDYYDRQGRPIDLVTWARSFERDRQIGDNTVVCGDERVSVSTVWLGLDHRFGRGGPPLIFETMLFGGPLDQYQKRYSTEAEAKDGHEKAVAALRAADLAWFEANW